MDKNQIVKLQNNENYLCIYGRKRKKYNNITKIIIGKFHLYGSVLSPLSYFNSKKNKQKYQKKKKKL